MRGWPPVIPRPFPNRPYPHPVKHPRYPWVIKPKQTRRVTICIAAHAIDAEREACIVVCCDWMISDGVSIGTETMMKTNTSFAPGYIALESGPVEHSRDLQEFYRNRIGQRLLDRIQIKEELSKGFSIFAKRLKRRNGDLSANELLVCGFPGSRPIIAHIGPYGVSEVLSFCAIGSGHQFADSLLRWRQAIQPVDTNFNVHDVLYRVFEAKRFSEVADGVGKLTSIGIMHSDKAGGWGIDWLSPRWKQFLEAQVRKYGPQQLPEKREYFGNAPNMSRNPGGHSGSDS